MPTYSLWKSITRGTILLYIRGYRHVSCLCGAHPPSPSLLQNFNQGVNLKCAPSSRWRDSENFKKYVRNMKKYEENIKNNEGNAKIWEIWSNVKEVWRNNMKKYKWHMKKYVGNMKKIIMKKIFELYPYIMKAMRFGKILSTVRSEKMPTSSRSGTWKSSEFSFYRSRRCESSCFSSPPIYESQKNYQFLTYPNSHRARRKTGKTWCMIFIFYS